MKTLLFGFVFLLLSCVISRSTATIRGSRNEKDEIVRDVAREISNHVERLSITETLGVSTLPLATVADVPVRATAPAPTPAASGAILTGSHIAQWGSGQVGCSYALPSVTVLCGSGGIISLVQKNPSIKACVTSSNNNSIVCSTISKPTVNSEVTVTCSGKTTAQTTANLLLPASQATCNELLGVFPQAQTVVRGGGATVLGLLARYCRNSQGQLFLNSNYTCSSGKKNVTNQGVTICVSSNSCNTQLRCNSSTPATSCPGSCVDKLGAVTVSDPDARASCINQGPRPSPLPASLHTLTWSSFRGHCSSTLNNVTVSCGSGGAIVRSGSSPEVSLCTRVTPSKLSCARKSVDQSASIAFFCYGTTETARTATAVLTKGNATNCITNSTANTINVATQSLLLQRYCGVGNNVTARPSRACGNASQLVIAQPQGIPICIASNECISTSKKSCSIPLASVSVSDASTDPTCTVAGPSTFNF